jgi:outer membrane protein assembly factor BamB
MIRLSLVCSVVFVLISSFYADSYAEELDVAQWCGDSTRNLLVKGAEGRLPDEWEIGSFDESTGRWDLSGAKNIRWVVPLGSQTYGTPIVLGDKLFCATNNGAGYLAEYPKKVDLGCLLAFDRRDGSFLWQHSVEKHPAGREIDWPLQGICSNPIVQRDRLWVVTNRAEVVCLSTDGDPKTGKSKVIWTYDMIGQLGVHPHNMASCSPTVVGDLLLINTSNGVDESHDSIPAPDAPSFIALDKNTGRLVWADSSPGKNLLHGQWSSVAAAEIGGVKQAIFAGGDGWVYSFRAERTGSDKPEPLWRFDCNPKESTWDGDGMGDRASLVSTPVVVGDRVYIGTGHDPEFGEAPGLLWAIDANGRGDISPTLAVDSDGKPLPVRRWQAVDPEAGEKVVPNPNSGAIWCYKGGDLDGDGERAFEEEMHRTIGTVVVADGILVVTDLAGLVHAVDVKTGKLLWTYDLMAASWSSPLVVGGKIYQPDEDGDIVVLRLGRTKEVLAENSMDDMIYSTPVVIGDTLYIATKHWLYAIEKD